MRVFLADVVEFFAGDVVVKVVVSRAKRRVVGCGIGGQLHEFAVRFGLDDTVDVAVGCVVPDALGCEVHSETVG